jgi:hypothetical protein
LPIAWFVLTFRGFLGLLDQLPGLADGSSRLDLAQRSISIGDAAFTGGGLWLFQDFFPIHYGYSVFRCTTTAMIFLDVALEQGVVGGVALLMVLC